MNSNPFSNAFIFQGQSMWGTVALVIPRIVMVGESTLSNINSICV